jgi:hypothetical protein
MLDNDDASLIALLWPTGGGLTGFIVFVAVVCILMAIVSANEDDCSKQVCEAGAPSLVDGECLCVQKAKSQ